MPKSKNRRKNRKDYRPENHHVCSYVMLLRPEDRQMLEGIFTDAACAVEYKLAEGRMTLDDTQILRDYINLGTALNITGHHLDKVEIDGDWRADYMRFKEAFHTFYQKAVHKNCFTCTADELEWIREGCVIADAIFKAEMKHEPAWVFSNLLYVKHITDLPHASRVTVDADKMDAAIRRVCQQSHNVRFVRRR